MSRVFVDTSAILGLLDRADPRHGDVLAAFAALHSDDLITHGYVVAETLAVARRRFGVDGVITVLDEVLPAINVRAIDAAVHADAQARFRDSLPSGVSFVDQVSRTFIEQEGIELALTLDPDLEIAEVTVIPTA